jgi:hypothetical protein
MAKFFRVLVMIAVSFHTMSYSLVVPTLNGGFSWKRAAAAITSQQPKPNIDFLARFSLEEWSLPSRENEIKWNPMRPPETGET